MDLGGKIIRMKHLLCAVIAAILFICGLGISPDPAESVEETPANRITVYYFHGNFRCVNCHNIEQYTKEAVNKYFRKELNARKVVFKVINVETKGNEHFTNDYQLYTKSVVLALVKNGKEVKFDNLTKVWEYLRDKEVFQQYIKNEVEKYLKAL